MWDVVNQYVFADKGIFVKVDPVPEKNKENEIA